MKTNSSRYVLAAEILIIILFHVVKIKQADKHAGEMAFTRVNKTVTLPKVNTPDKSSIEYLLVNLVK
jgi:hypothetical protein